MKSVLDFQWGIQVRVRHEARVSPNLDQKREWELLEECRLRLIIHFDFVRALLKIVKYHQRNSSPGTADNISRLWVNVASCSGLFKCDSQACNSCFDFVNRF